MKVLKTNPSDLKYKFYNMRINLEKAKIARLEQAKSIEFKRLEFAKNKDSFNLSWIINKSKYEKKIYEFDKISETLEKAFYGERVRLKELGYTLLSYSPNNTFESLRNFVEFQINQFIKDYVENGLGCYDFEMIKGTNESNKRAYIFLNNLGKNGISCYTDNVVSLPNEIIAMYLLEKGLGKEAIYYLNLIEENKRINLLENFDFEDCEKLIESEYENLMKNGFLVYDYLKRSLSFGKTN